MVSNDKIAFWKEWGTSSFSITAGILKSYLAYSAYYLKDVTNQAIANGCTLSGAAK